MLMMRARSWALRDGFADVLRGLSIREEADVYDGVATALPDPAFAGSPDRPVSRLRHPIARPRFADYLVFRAPAGTARLRPHIDTYGRKDEMAVGRDHTAVDAATVNTGSGSLLAVAEHVAPRAEPAPPDAGPLVTAEHEHTDETRARTEDGQITSRTEEQDYEQLEPLVTPDTDGRLASETSPSAAYALIDAEGGIIDIDGLEALRTAFHRLFADPHLTAAQVLGLWESNDVARAEIERAFGAVALAEPDHRRQSAERKNGEYRSSGTRKGQRAGALFDQRTASAAADASVLDHTGESRRVRRADR